MSDNTIVVMQHPFVPERRTFFVSAKIADDTVHTTRRPLFHPERQHGISEGTHFSAMLLLGLPHVMEVDLAPQQADITVIKADFWPVVHESVIRTLSFRLDWQDYDVVFGVVDPKSGLVSREVENLELTTTAVLEDEDDAYRLPSRVGFASLTDGDRFATADIPDDIEGETAPRI